MKIKRIHTQVAVMSLDHKFSFDSSLHKLEYVTQYNMFKIDRTLVPVSNIREVLLEEQVMEESEVVNEVSTATNSNTDFAKSDSNKKESPGNTVFTQILIDDSVAPSAKKAVTTEDAIEVITDDTPQVKRTRAKRNQ